MATTTEPFSMTNTTNYSCIQEEPLLDLTRAVVSGTIAALLMILIFTGNGIVVLAVATNSNLRNNMNYLIVNLACADLCLGLFMPFVALVFVYDVQWPFGYLLCDIWVVVDILLCNASILTFCVISIDRYIRLTRPLRYSFIVTTRRIILVIVSVWVISLGISLPSAFWNRSHPKNDEACKNNTNIGFTIFSVSASFYIPTIAVCFIYIKIYKIARQGYKKRLMQHSNRPEIDRCRLSDKSSCARNCCSNSVSVQKMYRKRHQCYHVSKYCSPNTLPQENTNLNMKIENKALKTIAKVIGVFIVCWLPFFILLPLVSFCPKCYVPKTVFNAASWLGYCNSMMNPLIYAFSSKKYKTSFLRLLWGCKVGKCLFGEKS